MEGSAANPVHLEFSRDFGASWHPVQPQCQARWQDSPLCSTPLQPSSKYYMGSASGWWREVIHVGRLQLCGLVRFRWYQGFYPPGMPPLVTWAIDNIYIGPQCEAMCSHHGMCINGSLCICDKGYSGMTCEEGPTQPNFLVEDFEGMPSSNKFLMWSGGKPSRHCGLLLSGSSLYFGENGLRMLVTADLDLSHARFLQFFLRLGCSKAAPNAQTQPLLLQFSTDGGQTWTLLQELCFLNMSHRVHYVALEIPLKAAGPTTRLRWWHPSRDGYFHDPWAIDQIVVGGSTSGLRELEDNFSTLDDHRWLLHPGASISTLCRASSNGLAFINKTVWRYAVTSDLPIDKDSFLQFDFVADCDSKTFCYCELSGC
uniref:Reelin n=1 Tax=Eptatretus burgeri TaxID=7764 RepID=A0A8C4QA32_EPTBU